MSEIKNDEYIDVENLGLVYRSPQYEGPIAVNCTISEELDDYHKKSTIYFMTKMTQEEFDETIKNHTKSQYKPNIINYAND